VWAESTAGRPPPPLTLKAAAASVAQGVGGTELLVIPAGQWVVWAWAAGDSADDTAGGRLPLEDGLMCALGGVGSGPQGFVDSHHDARRTRRVLELLAHRPGSVARYRDHALTALLTSDGAAAGRFVATELGPLSADTDAAGRLRATLAAWFEEGMSWSRTAQRLGVHQNTVIYRARRAEDLLGRPLTERRPELEAALRLAGLRGALAPGGADGL
jgi:hypothetical protein